MSQRSRFAAACTVLLTGLVFAPVAQAATACTPTKWPAPPGAELYQVTETDGRGTYLGWASFGPNDSDTIIWHADGVIERLQDFGASDINGNGLMSGTVVDSNGVAHAATRTPSGEITTLSNARSTAVALNDRGDIVGYELYERPAGQIVYAWTAGGTRVEGLSGWGFARPHAVDEGGLVPFTYQWRGVDTAYIYQLVPGGTARRLQTYAPVGTVNPIELADAADGLVVATRTEAGQQSEIVLIEPVSGTITPVPGSRGATPIDLSNGVVVGKSGDRATMWRDGETVVLPALAGSTPRDAILVNADGTEVFGTSWDADGYFATVWRCSP